MSNVKIGIEGMSCTNCALGVQRFLEKKGAAQVQVSFPNSEATFELTEKTPPLADLMAGIEKMGYHAHIPTDEPTATSTANDDALTRKLIIAAIFTLPLMLSMLLPFPFLHNGWVQFALCLPVFAIGVQHFGISAWRSLQNGVPNMDVLIIVGATAAFIYSLVGLLLNLGHNYMFWETAAGIITLVLLGNVLEHRAVKRTTAAMRELLQLQPDTAKLVQQNPDGTETIIETNARKLQTGQVVLVGMGEKIPADGKVIWGEGWANEAMMTGESMPLAKPIGSEVIGGTLLDSGSIRLAVTRTAQNSTLAHIIQLVADAQAKQPPIHKLADRISAIFVPLVIGVALLTFFLEYFVFGFGFQAAMLNAIAVLVISCPCAMGLATPTAIMVGIGRAARQGILVKGGDVLEQLAKVQYVVFDKTGTLTTGQFTVKNLHISAPQIPVSAILLGLAQHSAHPLSKSLAAELRAQGIVPQHFSTISEEKGVGISGTTPEGITYRMGSYALVRDFTTDNTHNIYLADSHQLLAYVDMEDPIRPDAADALRQLDSEGINTLLLSGDRREKVAQLAQQLGIKSYKSEQLPANKLEEIDQLSHTYITAMVGDGVNDAPALARASVGVSLGNATPVAMESADVVLLQNRLAALPEALLLGKATLRTVKQNLFWAFFYNVIAIPLAALGMLTPLIAAAAMALSDVVVIGNSLWLRFKRL